MIKRACSVPTSQLTYTDEDFVTLADDNLKTQVVPLIMSAREEYFVDYVDVLSPADGVIPFPSPAVGEKLRSVCYVIQTSPQVLINLPRIDLDVVAGIGFFNPITFAGFYIQGNDIVLYPNTSVPVNTTIRLFYYKRTLVLAPPSEYGQVVSVDLLTNTVVVDNVPSDWAIGTELNSVGSQPNFLTTNESTLITALSTPSIILSDATGIEVGDYLAEIGFSGIAQVPIEGHNWLSQLTAVSCLDGLGDYEGAARAQQKADILKQNFLTVISQRVDGSVKKIVSPNGGLRLQAGIRRRGRGWW